MSMTRWVKIASVLLVAGATVSGVGLISRRAASGSRAGDPENGSRPALARTCRSPRSRTASSRFPCPSRARSRQRGGRTCSARSRAARPSSRSCPRGPGSRRAISSASSTRPRFATRLTNQKIATQGAEATYQNARLARENAEIAVKEYQEGTYLLEKSTILGEIKLAESALQKAKARLERTRRARQRLNDTRSRKEAATGASDILAELDLENQLDSTEQTLMREQVSLEKAQGQLNLLDKYTKDRMIRDLGVKVEERRSVELAKEQILQIEREKEARLEKQIVNCKLIAPGDGVVVYANDPNRISGPPVSRKAPRSASGRSSSACPIISQMQVNAKVHESQIGKIVRRHEGEDSRRRLRGHRAGGDGDGCGSAPRPDQLPQLGHQGLHHPRHDRQALAGPPAGHDGKGRDPCQRARQRAQRPGQVRAAVRRQGSRCRQEARRRVRMARRDRGRCQRRRSSKSSKASSPESKWRSTRPIC